MVSDLQASVLSLPLSGEEVQQKWPPISLEYGAEEDDRAAGAVPQVPWTFQGSLGTVSGYAHGPSASNGGSAGP
jgi:hypothetical protein